jgi:uncharacterized protein
MAGETGRKLSGETDLAELIATMRPQLFPELYAFRYSSTFEPDAFALIREDEGTTVVVPDPDGDWARITLTVHSSLHAVGLTAAFARALADAGISANVIAGLYHDHIFVPWPRRHDAMDALHQLAAKSR